MQYLILLLFPLLAFWGCMRQVPVVILEYPPRAFEAMDSLRLEQRITRHMSGRVENMFFVCEDSAGNEIKHGPDVLYYLDGQKKQVQYYRKGRLWGPATFWYNNGQRQGISFYTEGKLDGVSKTWNKEGRLLSVKYWKAGKLHGPQTEYDSLGGVRQRRWWQENKIVPAPPPAQVVDTVHRDSTDSMALVPDTMPVPMADSTLPAAQPEFYPVP